MPSPAHLAAALAYWKATGGGSLPDLPDNPADAAAALLRARPLDTWACRFGRADLGDPWPALAVGDGDVTWPEVAWAIGCADLAPAATGHDGSVLVIDRCPDPRGEHRAFFVTRAGEVTGPWFASTSSLLEWAAALAEAPADDDGDSELDREPPPRDIWNRSTLSAVGALAAWRLFSPALFYRALRARAWPDVALDPGAPRAGDPARTNLLRAVGRFAKARALALPPMLDESALTAPQRALVERLRDLAHAAGTGEAPRYVTALAEGADPERAAAAKAWLAQYGAKGGAKPGAKPAPKGAAEPEGARGGRRKSAPQAATDRAPDPDAPADERYRAAYAAVDRCLKQLVADGDLEIEPRRRSELVDEVLAAMMKATSGDRAIKAAVGVVLESPLVDEVFADDVHLLAAFRKALGG